MCVDRQGSRCSTRANPADRAGVRTNAKAREQPDGYCDQPGRISTGESAEPARDVIFRELMARPDEQFVGLANFDQITEVKKGRAL